MSEAGGEGGQGGGGREEGKEERYRKRGAGDETKELENAGHTERQRTENNGDKEKKTRGSDQGREKTGTGHRKRVASDETKGRENERELKTERTRENDDVKEKLEGGLNETEEKGEESGDKKEIDGDNETMEGGLKETKEETEQRGDKEEISGDKKTMEGGLKETKEGSEQRGDKEEISGDKETMEGGLKETKEGTKEKGDEGDKEEISGDKKKSKNQIKRERRRALWRENKEAYKEKRRKKKEEKEEEEEKKKKEEEEEEEEEESEFSPGLRREKRKAEEDAVDNTDIKKAKLETKALKAKRPGFSEERYNETSYFIENGLRKVYPYYFTFTTFTKGRWVGEKILDVFAKEFRAHPAEQYERCIKTGTLTVNYEKVDTDYRLKHNDLLANIVHRHEVPVTADSIPIVHVDEDLVVVDKPASIPVHPCGRYRHNTVVFILAKEYNLKNLRTIHRLDRLTSGLLLFGRTPKKAREMEQQIRTRQVTKEYVCRVEGEFPRDHIECNEPIEVVSYKIGVCKVSPTGKDCRTEFQRLSYNGVTSVVLCRPHTGRMHQIRVHLQYLGFPIVNDPLYNHTVFGPNKAKGGIVGKSDDQLIQDLIKIHNAENWLGMDGDAEYSMFKPREKADAEEEGGSQRNTPSPPKDKSPLPPPPPPHHAYNSTTTAAAAANGITNAATGGGGGGGGGIMETIDGGGGGGGGGGVVSSGTQTGDNQGVRSSITSVPITGSPITGAGTPLSGIGTSITSTPVTGAPVTGGRDYNYQSHLMTVDEHCYECKVRYRDPKPRDLVMYLHALKYSGPGWQFETKLPDWAAEDWANPDEDQ